MSQGYGWQGTEGMHTLILLDIIPFPSQVFALVNTSTINAEKFPFLHELGESVLLSPTPSKPDLKFFYISTVDTNCK